MRSTFSYLLLALVLLALASPKPLFGQEAVTHPDVAKGIKLVEDGDYDGAILTLDNAARHLAAEPSRARDLSQAYLYLGIAYVGKGHEAAARAKFREALSRIKDLTLSPEKFSPKVIDLFEAAREDVAKGPPPRPAAAVESPKKKGGGAKIPLILLGAGGAVAGVALAAGGGGSQATSAPLPTIRTENFTGTLGPPDEGSRHFTISVAAAGGLEAVVTWTTEGGGRPAELAMELYAPNGAVVGRSNRTSDTSASLTASVQPQQYDLSVFMGDCGGCRVPFNLTIRHP